VTKRGLKRQQQLRHTQQRRLWVLAFAVVLGYGALIGRAVQLQAVDAEWLSARADSQHNTTLKLGPLRGAITDRHGTLLASSADAESVAASPRRIEDRMGIVKQLGRALAIPPIQLNNLIGSPRSFVWVKRWVTPDQADRVRKLDLDGISLHPERKRFYPSRGLAASYVGFAGRDGEGLSGLEKAFDGALRGTSTALPIQRDARGGKLVHWKQDPNTRTGARIKLALDARMQHMAESLLEKTLNASQAKHATLVAMDPRNGDLLTLAEWPSFNPNRFWLEDAKTFRASGFVDVFEPGSTLKPFVVALALDQGLVTPDEEFDCENGSWRVYDRVIHDFKPHGVLSVRDIIRLSSNIGAAKIAERLGSAGLINGLRKMGFGEATHSGFPGEATGVVRRIREAQRVERANIAFGQGITVTAVQLASAGAALANGGTRIHPRLALEMEGPGGRLDWPIERGERVMSERTAQIVLEMMRRVVADGTGKAAALKSHAVAGKTGTSQKVVNGAYSKEHFVASFLGIVPVQQPRLVIAIVIDEPRGAYTGGAVAAPVFRAFAEFAVEQLALPREGSV